MSNKLRKKKVVQEEVKRGFEVEFDEKHNEVILVMHYRYEWGDPIDMDVEHILTYEDCVEFRNTLESYMTKIVCDNQMKLITKSIGPSEESNPLQKGKDHGENTKNEISDGNR